MNRSFKIALMVSALGIVGAASASAAPELFFYPAQSWSVERSETGNSYGDALQCGVQTSFNNGFIVSIHGGSRAVDALSIDFRQDAFESGKDYTVGLSVPGKFKDSYAAQAVDAAHLQVDVLQNKDFYKHIRSAGVFDLSVEGNDFRFYLTGFAAAAGGFESCMAGAKPQDEIIVQRHHDTLSIPVEDETLNEAMDFEKDEITVVDETLAPITLIEPARAPAEIAVVESGAEVAAEQEDQEESSGWFSNLFSRQEREEEVAEAVSELDTQDREQITLIEELSDFVGADSAPAPKETEAEAQIDTAEVVAEPVAEEPMAVQELEAPRAVQVETYKSPEMVVHKKTGRMEVDFTELDKPAPECNTGDLANIHSIIAGLRADNAKLQRRVDASNDALVSAVAEAEDLKAAQSDIVGTRSDIEQVASELNRENAKLKRELAVSQAALAQAEESLAEAKGSRAGEAGEMSDMQLAIRKLKTENAALTAELEAVLTAERTEQVSIASNNWNLERATLRFNEAERQLKVLGQQLQRERTQCAMEKKDLELMLFDPEVTSQAQLAELAKLEAELAAAKAELARMKSDLAR